MGRRRRLLIDVLEGRDLLSVTPLIGSPAWTRSTSTSSAAAVRTLANQGGSSQLSVDPATGIVVNTNLGGSGVTTDVSPPRLNELQRRAFTAKFTGKVQEEPPRLLDQARQFYVLAPGTTNQFLHGTVQLRYYTPNPVPITIPDPSNPGTPLTTMAFATTGSISMSDRSTQSGGVILANLTGSTANEDSQGRPTHFNLSLNGGGGSGGIYASSTGSGTVDIAYKGNRVTVTVHASIFIQGIGEPLNIFQTSHH
jgi:hypothetical protein